MTKQSGRDLSPSRLERKKPIRQLDSFVVRNLATVSDGSGEASALTGERRWSALSSRFELVIHNLLIRTPWARSLNRSSSSALKPG
jgi:hypothetical protein